MVEARTFLERRLNREKHLPPAPTQGAGSER